MKKLLLSLILLQSAFFANAQKEARFCIQFDDSSRIEKVETRFSMPGQEVTHIFVPGREIEKKKWMFTVPDTVFRKYWALKLIISRRENDTLVQGETLIKVPGEEPGLLISNIFYFPQDSIPFLKLKTDSIVYNPSGKFLGIIFRLTNPGQTAILNAELSTRCYSLMGKSREILAYLSGMLEKYPDSEVVSRWAFFRLDGIKFKMTANELQEIYNLFSEKDKQSDNGKKFHAYLEGKKSFNFNHFPNLMLPENKTASPQYVIRDSSHYNLVIFSHSACAPCHAMIPLLKEIYNDLKDKLEITYISADNKHFVKNWQRVMREQSVPWRSLLSADDHENIINNTYQISSFPTAYLVYPGGKFEKIDVREKPDKEKLYRLVSGSQKHPGTSEPLYK